MLLFYKKTDFKNTTSIQLTIYIEKKETSQWIMFRFLFSNNLKRNLQCARKLNSRHVRHIYIFSIVTNFHNELLDLSIGKIHL